MNGFGAHQLDSVVVCNNSIVTRKGDASGGGATFLHATRVTVSDSVFQNNKVCHQTRAQHTGSVTHLPNIIKCMSLLQFLSFLLFSRFFRLSAQQTAATVLRTWQAVECFYSYVLVTHHKNYADSGNKKSNYANNGNITQFFFSFFIQSQIFFSTCR